MTSHLFTGTIAAISTPLGEGGLAVLRLSGPDALTVADRIFVPRGTHNRKPSAAASHTVHYGQVVHEGRTLDEVLVTVMRAPRTFTREDVVEIACHGGVLVTRQVLEAALGSGARLAEPGEFTQRAFLNGRLDLAQAEAVADLIHSRTELAMSAANHQLAGKLSQRVNQLRDSLMNVLAHIEAHLDFPEEDISPDTRGQLLERLRTSLTAMDELLRTAREGQILRRGVRAAIIGRPNAGKSSLLNQLLGHERAIVSSVAGTTRDTIEETASVGGIPVVFVDTAGLREARDEIELEGIRRTRQAATQAEILLHVLDASEPLAAADQNYLAEFAGSKRVVVLNKADLPRQLALAPMENFVAVSCLSGQGISELRDAIKALIWEGGVAPASLEVVINARHHDALRRARDATSQAVNELAADQVLEVVALELRTAAAAAGEVVGKTTTEDLLDQIFRQFCIGK
jgi:tRNA modification GTPase